MIVLDWFNRLLKLLEQISEVVSFLLAPAGISTLVCLLSYELLLFARCDAPSAAVLASAIALTWYCGFNHPQA